MMKKISALTAMAFILTACGPTYQVESDLTPEQQEEQRDTIENFSDQLRNFNAEESKVNETTLRQAIANSYYLLGDYDNAIKYNEEVLKYAPNNVAAQKNLATIYERVEEYEKALDYISELHFNNPSKYGYLEEYVRILVKAGEFENARTEVIEFQIKYENEDNKAHIEDQYSFIQRLEQKAAQESEE